MIRAELSGGIRDRPELLGPVVPPPGIDDGIAVPEMDLGAVLPAVQIHA